MEFLWHLLHCAESQQTFFKFQMKFTHQIRFLSTLFGLKIIQFPYVNTIESIVDVSSEFLKKIELTFESEVWDGILILFYWNGEITIKLREIPEIAAINDKRN